MKLEVGKWYKARNGLRAFVKKIEHTSPTLTMIGAVIATVVYSDNSIRRVWKRNGKIIDTFLSWNSYDLIEEWKDDWSELVDKDQTERRNGNNFVSKSYGVHDVYIISEVGDYETSMDSPIQEKTVKELVPGVYGKINVGWIHNNKASLGFDRSYLDSDVLKHATVMHELSSSELRAAAKTFNEIADYLDKKK